MRAFLAGTLLVLAFAAAGCGGGSPSSNGSGNGEAAKPAQQVVADAVKAAEGASSFRMSGQIGQIDPHSAQQSGIDITVVKGKGVQGSMTLKGQKVDLVVIGSDGYMKAGAAYWTQFGGSSGGAMMQLVADKWLKFPTTNPQFAGFTALTTPKFMFDQMKANAGTPINKGATTYKGQNVVAIEGGPSKGTLYVANSGTPYPVALVTTGSIAITFDSWNKSVTLTAPSRAIDFSQLGG